MRKILWMALWAATMMLANAVNASETVDASEAKAPAKEAMCQTCHGKNGAKPILPNYPKLNGQNKVYLVESLKAYKNGQRTGGLTAVMAAQAAMLTETEMNELAEFYANQK